METSFWTFVTDHQQKLLELLLEHVGLTLLSLALAMVVAVPLGIVLRRRRRVAAAVIGVAGILQTLPSLALLGFLIPWMGIGLGPAVLALVVYAILPILRNTYTGIIQVDAAVVEAATGMGMTPRQVLWRVQLPLALPVLLAGVRTAAVINVGVATLAAYIGAGGLGEYIFGGIALNNTAMLWAGAIPAALLAVAVDQLLALAAAGSKGQRQHTRGFAALGAGVATVALTAAFSQSYPQGLRAGFDPEFAGRPDGYPQLVATYGLEFNTTLLNTALMYTALYEGQVDVVSGYATEGRIKAFDLVVLADDRHAFPPYHCAPLVGNRLRTEYPEVVTALELLAGTLTDSLMTELNHRVDFGQQPPAQVARQFLEAAQLWRPDQATGGPRLVIGSKPFTEQYILAEIFAQLINGHTRLDTELKPGMGGTQICFEALRNGGIDLYPEYTGTGLEVILQAPASQKAALRTDPSAVYAYVREASATQLGVHWLSPLGFNNTYALMVRRQDAQAHGWRKISDLTPGQR